MKKFIIIMLILSFYSCQVCYDPVGYSHFYIENRSNINIIVEVILNEDSVNSNYYTLSVSQNEELLKSTGLGIGPSPSHVFKSIIIYNESDEILLSYPEINNLDWEENIIQYPEGGSIPKEDLKVGIKHYTLIIE